MILAINNYLFLTKKRFKKSIYRKMIVVGNRVTQETFKVSICNFLGLKNVKKGYIEMTKKIYLETLKSVPGSSISHY